jgi:hypothetical protein
VKATHTVLQREAEPSKSMSSRIEFVDLQLQPPQLSGRVDWWKARKQKRKQSKAKQLQTMRTYSKLDVYFGTMHMHEHESDRNAS